MAETTLSDGSQVRVGTVLATQALTLQTRLLKIVGNGADKLPTIMQGYGKDATPESKLASDAAAIGALGEIVAGADPVAVTTLMVEIIGYCQIKPQGQSGWQNANLDAHFTDRKADIYPTVIFTLKEIFGDFFSALPVNGILDRVKDSAN